MIDLNEIDRHYWPALCHIRDCKDADGDMTLSQPDLPFSTSSATGHEVALSPHTHRRITRDNRDLYLQAGLAFSAPRIRPAGAGRPPGARSGRAFASALAVHWSRAGSHGVRITGDSAGPAQIGDHLQGNRASLRPRPLVLGSHGRV